MNRLELYRPLFGDNVKPAPEDLDDPVQWVLDNIEKTHPLKAKLTQLAEEKNWTPAQTVAFYLMVVDGAACSQAVQLATMAMAAAGMRAQHPIFVRPIGTDSAVNCMAHPQQPIGEGEPCPACIDEAVAMRPDGVSAEDARAVIYAAAAEGAMEFSEDAAQNAPSSQTKQ